MRARGNVRYYLSTKGDKLIDIEPEWAKLGETADVFRKQIRKNNLEMGARNNETGR